jgi:hypothetical protein
VLRIWAVISIALWLVRVAACDFEHLLGLESGDEHTAEVARQVLAYHDEHDSAATAGEQSDAHADGTPGGAPEGHSDGSHHQHGKGDLCCTTLKAVVQAASPIIVAKPALHPHTVVCALLAACDLLPQRELETRSDRRAKSREWVFTPEVCLGPAIRSHAPPVFHVI